MSKKPTGVRIFEGKASETEKEVSKWLVIAKKEKRTITKILQSGVDTPTGARIQISIFYADHESWSSSV